MWVKGTTAGAVYGTIGVGNAANQPESRYEPLEWTDKDGVFWMFGGIVGSGEKGDMWKYDPFTDEWTWMNGTATLNQTGVYGVLGVPSSNNTPGGRGCGVTWTDTAGYLWMFAGAGSDSVATLGELNDLWRYDPHPLSPTYNQWTWMHGSGICAQPGVYGTIKIPAPANVPGSHSGIIQ